MIIEGSDQTTTVMLDPPARGAAGLATEDRSVIERVTYCYLARLPQPSAT